MKYKINLFLQICIVLPVNCSNEVTAHYYSSRMKFVQLCYVCGSSEIIPISEELKTNYQSAHPVCGVCKRKGYEERTRNKTKVQNKKRKTDK